jgi:DNA topoisomerase IB
MRKPTPNDFIIDDVSITFLGNPDGSTSVKFNRVAMIAKRYNQIKEDLLTIIKANGTIHPLPDDYRKAVALLIIMKTGIRIGNEESAEGFMTEYKEKGKEVFAKTYGLTTMLQEHIFIRNQQVFFSFTGKKHVLNEFKLDKDLSQYVIPIIKENAEPVFRITESELTSFIKRITSRYFSSKDFRTFRANVFAFEKIKTLTGVSNKKEHKEAVKMVLEYVSEKLNNTPQVCKTSYIDPRLYDYILGEPEKIEKEVKEYEKRINNQFQKGGLLIGWKKHLSPVEQKMYKNLKN